MQVHGGRDWAAGALSSWRHQTGSAIGLVIIKICNMILMIFITTVIAAYSWSSNSPHDLRQNHVVFSDY